MLRTTRLSAGRRVWLLCAFVALAAFGAWRCVVAASGDAPDFRVYEAAVAAQRAGEDPYRIESIERHGGGRDLSHVYPPLSTWWIAPIVDHGFGFAAVVYALCLLAATVLLGLVFTPATPLWWAGLAAFATTGFVVARWNFQAGNLGLVELFAFAVACALLRHRRLVGFSIAIGAVGFVKLVPLSFSALLLPLVLRREVRWHVLLWPACVFALCHAASYALYPDLTASWWQMLQGSIEGQHTPWHERTSGNNNPTFLLLLLDLVDLEPGIGLGDLTMLVLLAGGAFVVVRAAQRMLRSTSVVDVLPLATIALLLCWPRLKPYGYGYAWVAVVVGAASLSCRARVWLVALLGAVPILLPWSPNVPLEALQLVKRNHLAVLLLIAGLVFAIARSPRADAISASDASATPEPAR